MKLLCKTRLDCSAGWVDASVYEGYDRPHLLLSTPPLVAWVDAQSAEKCERLIGVFSDQSRELEEILDRGSNGYRVLTVGGGTVLVLAVCKNNADALDALARALETAIRKLFDKPHEPDPILESEPPF